MEIISIPLEGDLEHQDSMGNTTNQGRWYSGDERRNFFTASTIKIKISWLIYRFDLSKSKKCNARYDQITLDLNDRHNKLQQILSPNPEGVWIHQDAWFHIGKFDNDFLLYELKTWKRNLCFCFKGISR
jgi:hypothetical protein